MAFEDYIKKWDGGDSEKEKNSSIKQSKGYESYIEKWDPKVDEDYVSSFLSDWNSFSSRLQTAYNGLNWKSSKDNSYESAGNDLMHRANMIRSYMKQNQALYEEKSYNDFVSQLDDIENYYGEYMKAFSDARDYFSQWETEEDYNDYVAYQKDYDAKKNLNISAAEREIADLEAVKKEYDSWKYLTGPEVQAKYRQFADQYGDIKSLEQLISEKTAYLNQAKHIKEGITLSGVAGNADFNQYSGYVSTKSDSGWDRLFCNEYDDLYEYVNNQNGFREEYKSKRRAYETGNLWSDGETYFEEKGYDYLTDNEISIYNYYYAKEGKEKAQEYLDSIQESLNIRKATSMYSNMEGKTALELAFGVAAGLDQFESGIQNLFNTKDDYIPQSAYQIASGMVREDLADDSFNFWYNFKDKEWQGTVLGNSVGQVAYDAITTTANMAPSIITSMVIGMINPVAGSIAGKVGQIAGAGMMGASAAGNDYQQMLNLGYTKKQARWHSTLVGASEAGLQSLLGGISKLGGNVSIGKITEITNGIDNAFLRIAINLGGNMASEGLEEGLQEVLTPWFQNLIMHTSEDVNWSEVAYSSLLGALTAGFMEGGGTIYGEVNTYKTGRQLQEADISAARLADIGKTFSADTVAYQLAGRVNENTGAYTLGRLFNEIGATLTEQNVNEITDALVKGGIDRDIAKDKAKLMAKIVEGATLTDGFIDAIQDDKLLADAVRTTIIDSNATWFQRTKGYNEALMALAQEKTSPKATSTNPAEQGEENAPSTDKVDAENKNGSESVSEADASPRKVMSISTIKKGQVTIKLDDGTEVNVREADIDPDEGVRIDTISSIDGISTEDANFILNTLRTSPNVSAQMDSLGAKEAYKYGYYGFSQEHIAKHGVFANTLTETQRQAIYQTGQKARQMQTEAKQATVAKNATTEKSSVVGKVHFEGDRSTLTERQSVSLSAMEKVADALGVQIYVFESKVNERGKRIGANGWYDPKDSSIHIDLHAGLNGEGTMLFTAAHELTHHIRKWSPEKFKTLSDFLMQEYGKKGVNVDALVRAQMEKAWNARKRRISYDVAFEEVIADSMESMLADGNVLNRLEKLKAQDIDLWHKIKAFINELADKIRSVYKKLAPDSVEGRYVADMGKAVYKLQELFAEGLADASQNYQASLTPGEEGVEVNEDGDPVAYATADGSVLLSMRTYEEEGRQAFRAYLEKCVKSKKLTEAEMTEMLNGIEDIYQTCKEFKDKYAPFSSWSDAAVVRDTYGKPVFSVVTPNGDYKMNLDFSLVCKKRRTLDAVFNEMTKRGIIDDFELGQKSVVKINEIIRKYGLETACALCFVDAKRFRQASMADQFTSLYNELVKSLVPEDQRSSIDHFNFSGYENINKVEGGIDTWDNSKLDFSHINHVLKTYGDKTVEHKAAKYIKSHPEGRKLLLRGDFMSSKGFDAVKTQNQDILSLYNSKKGTGGPKAAFGDVQYMNEVIQKARWWTPAKAYAVGGVRIQSFSDYVPRMVFDYTQMIYDLAATKLPAHAYTKEALFVKQFGLTGVKINMSLIPAIVEGGIAPGLDANGNYVWAGESFDFETAKEIQNAEGYTENCGTICVGVSYKHILKLLGDPDIRMVIPYHKSGLNPIVAHMNKIAEFTDYTTLKTNPGGCQNTIDKNGSKVEVDFNFNEVLRKTGDPKATVRQYLNWCAKNEYTPRFAEFAWHENYYKLIEDFTLFDKDGKYVPQREVRAVFPKDTDAFGSMKKLIESGLKEDAIVEGKRDERLSKIVDEIQNTLPRTEAEIEEIQVAQADRDLEEIKLSDRDNAPTFYSHMARVVDSVKQNKLGASSVVSMLRGKGVKAEEIKWSGIEEWLDGKKSVTKAELQEFIAGSMLQIEEDVLGDKEIPYSQEHLDQIAKYEAERDIIAENLKTEWKRIVGTDIPITYFGAGLESAVVNNLLLANSEKKGNTEAGYQYKAKRAALQRVIEDADHYFGFDNARQAIREAVKDPKNFMKAYEMTAFEESVFKDFIKAKEAYSKVEGISIVDQRALIAIAESADRFSNRILKVKNEHRAEAAKYLSKYRGYTIKGGTNYRELLFRIPGSTYSNGAMNVHWERAGVLAHARLQDMNTFLGKMLFIEELQSDWHNEGHKSGYKTKADEAKAEAKIQTLEDKKAKLFDEIDALDKAHDSFLDEYWATDMTEAEYDRYIRSYTSKINKLRSEERAIDREINKLIDNITQAVPDAPFRDTYHEYVLKRLLREAAEQDYDSIGWTPSEIQVNRWSEEFAEGYRIEYDQDIPKFLNKYGKKWGTKVGKTVLDSGTEVWSMAITDEMKESVLTEGQPLYSDRVIMGSLFSGGGTLEAGLAYQMLDKQFGVEYDGKIASVYADNHGDHIQVGRVEDFDISKHKDIFYLHASPVCHNFSKAKHGAKELQMDIDSAKATAKHLETAMPQVFTVENAPGYRKSESLKIITDKLTELGYKWDVDVYNSADYGSATSRNRVILRAVKDGELPPKPTKQERTNSWDKVTRDLWDTLPKATLRPSFISAIENTSKLAILDANGKVNVNKPLLILTTTSGHTVTFCWEGEICPTLTTKCGEARLVMPDGNIYAVTPEFMGRIQGLPDDYKYPKEKTRAFTIIGNGIPTHLTKAVVGGVLDSAYEQTHDGQVLYSDRDVESVSNRSLLANAFEGVAQNDIEKQKIQEYKGKIDLIEAEERKLYELNQKIKDLSFSKGPRDTDAINALQDEARKTANRINTYDKQLIRLEASKPLRDVLEREKKKAYDRARERGEKAQQAYRDRSHRTQMMHKVQRIVGDLDKLLRNEDKKHHVPDSLKKAVANALALVNMDTVGADARIAYYADLIAKETEKADPDEAKIDAYVTTVENIQRQGEKMGQILKEMRDAYEEIANSKDPDIASGEDPVIMGNLKELAQTIGNTSIRDMTIEQLSDVYDMYKMVLTRVRDANKAMMENIKENISNQAARVIVEVRSTGGEKKYRASALDPVRKLHWNNQKPVYAMEHIGSATLSKLFDNVRAGEDVWAKDITEARQFYLDKSKKYGYNSWDFKKKYRFESGDGATFELSLAQMMSLYAFSKRDNAQDHLRLGGFVFDSNIETYKEPEETNEKNEKKRRSVLKYKVNISDAYQVSPETMGKIIDTMNGEAPNATKFVDEMQSYLSTTMGAKGNEVTMRMYGVKLFKEKFYFPMRSAKQFLFEQNEVAGEVRIKNSSFTNKVVPHANNPIILSDFMDVWAGHVNDMSMYHAFVLPLEDFNRVFNYQTPKTEGQSPVSVKGVIQSAYTPAAVSYVKELITDLNGGARTDSTTGIITKGMNLFKKGAVFASWSVVVQQPSAIARATALVDTKYFIGPKVDRKRHELVWDEVKKYAPVAIIKEMGYFDTNMGKSTQDFILGKEYDSITEKMKALFTDSDYRDEVLSKAPALADEIAWCGIWEAVKRETKANNKDMDVKSEAFLKKAGERFTEVIVKTQVYDSVLSRSANMRSKDTGMKMATAFMAEPTTSINMISDALLKAKRGDKKSCRKAIGSVIAAQILNAFLVSFVYAARDDDEEETYAEKYISTFTAEVLDGMNPATYIPFIKDIVSIVQGYDVERSDMAVISDLWKAYENLQKDNMTPYRKVEGFVGSICQIFGLPVKNIMRDFRSAFQAYKTITSDEETTSRGIKYALKEAITGKATPNTQQLYESRLDGDEVHEARVEARYEDEDSANAAVRQVIKDKFMAGEIDTATALKYMVLHTGMDASEAHWLMDAWEHKLSTGSDDGYSKYNDFYEAVKTGKNLKAVIKEYADNGVTNATMASQITAHFKPQYIEMTTSERANIKGYLLNAMELCGVDREDAQYRLDSWEYEAKYPELVDKITFSQYQRWEADGKPNGVSLELFTDVYEFRDDGTSDSVKSQEVVAEYINSLPISIDQKDALWCCFWKASTLKKAPWH